MPTCGWAEGSAGTPVALGADRSWGLPTLVLLVGFVFSFLFHISLLW